MNSLLKNEHINNFYFSEEKHIFLLKKKERKVNSILKN